MRWNNLTGKLHIGQASGNRGGRPQGAPHHPRPYYDYGEVVFRVPRHHCKGGGGVDEGWDPLRAPS